MSLFNAVEMAPRDPILGLTEQFVADTNPITLDIRIIGAICGILHPWIKRQALAPT